ARQVAGVNTATVLDAVHAYAANGWPVFAVRPRSKLPATPHGFRNATIDPAELAAMFSAPDMNSGFKPGGAGLCVIDIDGPAGQASAQRLGLLSEPTLEVVTPRGLHLYFRHPGGTIGNRQLGDGLDVRADSGYVLLPPS